jgi:hypothetical protein
MDLDARLSFGIVAFDRRHVAQLLSIVIFSSATFCPIALRKKRRGALRQTRLISHALVSTLGFCLARAFQPGF